MSETVAHLPMDQIKRFQRTMRRIPEDIRQPVLEELAEALVGEAQFDAPIKTGVLKDSHTVGEFENGSIVIGVNTNYALAVHETHPSKSRWFINAIARNFRRITRASIRKQLRERGAR